MILLINNSNNSDSCNDNNNSSDDNNKDANSNGNNNNTDNSSFNVRFARIEFQCSSMYDISSLINQVTSLKSWCGPTSSFTFYLIVFFLISSFNISFFLKKTGHSGFLWTY